MIHSSQSERAGHLLPADLERRMRAQLRQMRFGQPQEYARMEQAEVRKFLASKSVHNWLSEWNLSRTFGGSTMGSQYGGPRDTADFSVQCVAEEIDAEMGTAGTSAFPFPPSPTFLRQQDGTFRMAPAEAVELPDNSRNFRPNFHFRHSRMAPSMDASTNTQTTETTITTTTTGAGRGRMRVFRRASWLEEYAQQQLRRLEEREEEEAMVEQKQHRRGNNHQQQEAKEGRRRKGRRWLGCCGCTRRRTWSVESEERDDRRSGVDSSASSAKCGTSSARGSCPSTVEPPQPTAQTIVVKRVTLSSPGTTDRMLYSNHGGCYNGYCNGGGGAKPDWHCRNGGGQGPMMGTGNYDNVPEEWTSW